jgi:hypothetical protein
MDRAVRRSEGGRGKIGGVWWLGGRKGGGEEEEMDVVSNSRRRGTEGHMKFLLRKMERINEAERLEGWPNTAARLAGWRRVTPAGVISYVMYIPPAFSVPYRLPWQELHSCELMDFPAAVEL